MGFGKEEPPPCPHVGEAQACFRLSPAKLPQEFLSVEGRVPQSASAIRPNIVLRVLGCVVGVGLPS